MKCPKCKSSDLWTTTDQVSFYKSRVERDDDGAFDVHDGKRLDDGDWWIDPDAETSCDSCLYDSIANDFAEQSDKARVAEALDFFLYRELKSARACNKEDDAELLAGLLRQRGRSDLALAAKSGANNSASAQP